MLLRKIAKFMSEKDYEENVIALKKSTFWLTSSKLRNWFGNTWLVEAKVSGEASPTFGHANANFSLFIDQIRNQFLKK